MPKQIMVANKSRKQIVKVHFRQSPLSSRVPKTPERLPGLVDMDQSVVHQKSSHGACECMTFPGKLLKATYSSAFNKPPV